MGFIFERRMALRFSMKAKASKLAAAKLCPWPTQKCPDESWTIGELKSFVEGNGGDTSGVLEKQELYKLATEIGDRVLNDPLEAYMCGLREKAPTPAAAGEGSVRADIDEDEDDLEGTIQHIANTNKAVEEAEHEKEAMEGTGEIEECEQIARDAARGEAVDESIERMEECRGSKRRKA